MGKFKTKVLIIDDNHSILDYLKTALSRYDIEIETSTNGFEGLKDLAEFKPDIIFLDLMMPNIDGIKLLQLKKVLNDIKDIPVIVISANAGRNNVLAAIEAGADRVLSKPINLKLLRSTVDELLNCKNFEKNIKTEPTITEYSTTNSKKLSFIKKFGENKEHLIYAIKNRKIDSITEIIKELKEYGKNCAGIENLGILNDIEDKQYQRPSDWMFAELKVKELEQNLNQ